MITEKYILDRLTVAVCGTDKILFTEDERNEFASYYLDSCTDETTDDAIAEAFTDYWWETDRHCRRCSACGKLMREGYCINAGAYYYCSDDCLHTQFTEEEWAEEYENNDQSYYTEWETVIQQPKKVILQVNDRKAFDNEVWQTVTDFSEKQYNEWLGNAIKNLQKAKEILEDTATKGIDVYMIGDIINLLDTMHISTEHMENTWVVTADDFSEYDTDGLSEEEMEGLISLTAEFFNGDDCAGDCYQNCIRDAAEEYNLVKRQK